MLILSVIVDLFIAAVLAFYFGAVSLGTYRFKVVISC